MQLESLVAALATISGVEGIVIGHSKKSDRTDHGLEFGIYYQNPVDWQAVENIGSNLSGSEPVKFVPRDVILINQAIDDCLAGNVSIDYQIGHPHGFVNAMYAAEIDQAKILWQSDHKPISQMKDKLIVYPENMKKALVERFIFEAGISMESAQKAATRGDIHYLLGCFFRTVSCWNHVLHALNETYLVDEMGATKQVGKMPMKPCHYLVRVEQTYQYFALHYPTLAFEEFRAIHQEIKELSKKMIDI